MLQERINHKYFMMKVFSKTGVRLLIFGFIVLIGILYNKRDVFLDPIVHSNDLTSLKKRIDLNKIPRHIAVMMDGNGRWAAKQGKPRIVGHMSSLQSVEETIVGCVELQVPYLTLYAFSTENWERPQAEIDTLMQLFLSTIRDKLDDLLKHNIKLKVIGDINRLPQDCQIELRKAIAATQNNTGLKLIVALSYSGRWDIVQAARSLAQDVLNHQIHVDDITNESFQQYLSTQQVPDPDLLIRTGGDMRISNFLLWQLAYTELIILEKYWPEFRKEDLYKAIINYQQRDRRFGKVN